MSATQSKFVALTDLHAPAKYVRGKDGIDKANVKKLLDKLVAVNEQQEGAGWPFPPIDVHARKDGGYTVLDGIHRMTATIDFESARKAAFEKSNKPYAPQYAEIPATVYPATLTESEAFDLQFRRNNEHGAGLTTDQRDEAIRTSFKLHGFKKSQRGSQAKLAKLLGLSEATISRALDPGKRKKDRDTKKAARSKDADKTQSDTRQSSFDPKDWIGLIEDVYRMSMEYKTILLPFLKSDPIVTNAAARKMIELGTAMQAIHAVKATPVKGK